MVDGLELLLDWMTVIVPLASIPTAVTLAAYGLPERPDYGPLYRELPIRDPPIMYGR